MAKKANKKIAVEFADAITGMTPDQLLAHHLGKAEEHLIAAVKLFEKEVKPERHHDYVARLIRAQENVTWLYREELVRIRGPIKKALATAGTRKKIK